MTLQSAQVLSASLDKLQLGQGTSKSSDTSKLQPADSWEDEVTEDSPTDEHTPAQQLSTPVSDFPRAPPTSPISPSVKTKTTSFGSPFQTFPPFGMNGSLDAEVEDSPASTRSNPDKRPEKTTSVAARLIAAGIGQKAPRRTQEQREYDQAMKLQEKKRRDNAKEEATRSQREKEKAQLAIWED